VEPLVLQDNLMIEDENQSEKSDTNLIQNPLLKIEDSLLDVNELNQYDIQSTLSLQEYERQNQQDKLLTDRKSFKRSNSQLTL
jgi:hypothetical protein